MSFQLSSLWLNRSMGGILYTSGVSSVIFIITITSAPFCLAQGSIFSTHSARRCPFLNITRERLKIEITPPPPENWVKQVIQRFFGSGGEFKEMVKISKNLGPLSFVKLLTNCSDLSANLQDLVRSPPIKQQQSLKSFEKSTFLR